MKPTISFFILLLFSSSWSFAQKKHNSELIAATVMDSRADSLVMGSSSTWNSDQGILLEGLSAIWQRTADGKYFAYLKKVIDHFVQSDGSIRSYNQEEFLLDNIKNGKILLLLYKVTGQEKYFKAAQKLRQQLSIQPRTLESVFLHTKSYAQQTRLEDAYMTLPFYTEFSVLANDQYALNDIAGQLLTIEKNSIDPVTGLLSHGYDETREQKWADPKTGRSLSLWGQPVGYYAMALVDVLEYFPENHPKRDSLLKSLNKLANAIKQVQDQKSGVWFNILNRKDASGNYPESSVSAMSVYALAKGVRLGYLSPSYANVAEKGFEGIQKLFVEQVDASRINYTNTAEKSDLNANTDGSLEYYLTKKPITNNFTGIGTFLLAANEMELSAMPKPGTGKVVTVDNYFNNEYKKDVWGKNYKFHYTWDDFSNSGFWFLGNLFKNAGAQTNTLTEAPTEKNLQKTAVYIIVDPDNEKETVNPNFATAKDADELYKWVNKGGVLVLLTNDVNNAEIERFNIIPERFGIHFNSDMINAVKNDAYEMGAFKIPPRHPIFNTSKKVFIKEISTLKLSDPAKAVFKSGKKAVMATAKIGKGMVFAVGDPWFYNEYVDGRKLPAEYENFKAASDLVLWLIAQSQL